MSDQDALRTHVWLIVVGVALIGLGFLTLSSSIVVTIVTVGVLGMFLVIAGVIHIAHALSAPPWSGLVLSVVAGVLDSVVGLLLLTHPPEGTVMESRMAIGRLVAASLMTAGLFRIFVVPVLRMPDWPWALVSGVVSLFLGVAIAAWSVPPPWLVAAYVGIDMLVYGIALVLLGLAERDSARALVYRKAA